MKPIALKLENFGPYQREEIDFQNFYETPLFLISGKTGSGKTTIFDGMTFALFGETTGGIRQGKEMRSNFATLKEPTVVSFSFSHQGLIYEIEREPEQEVAKRVGVGTTLRPAKVNLTIYNEAGKELQQLTKAGEVRTFLEELLHLNAHQFTQIVLLPQGDFRKFLNADSNEKEVVLRQLFKTTIYRQLAEKIKEKRKLFQVELEQANQAIKVLFEQVTWVGDYREKQAELTGVQERLDLLMEQTKAASTALKQEQIEINDQRKIVGIKEAELQKLTQLAALYQEQKELEEQQQKLKQQEEGMVTEQKTLTELNWLAKQEPTLRRFEELQQELNKVISLQTENRKKVEDYQKNIQATVEEGKKLTGATDDILVKKQEETKLRQIEPLLTEKLRQEKERDRTSLDLEKVKQDIAKVKLSLSQLVEKNTTYVNKMNMLPEKQRVQEQLKSQVQRLSQWQEHTGSAETVQQELATMGQSYEEHQHKLIKKTQNLEKAKEELKQNKSHWARLQIARLSMDLIPGEPCLVCGSTEHPAPHEEQAFSPVEIKLVEEQLEAAESMVTAAQKALVKEEAEGRYLVATKEKMQAQLEKEQAWLEQHLLESEVSSVIYEALTTKQWSRLTRLLNVEKQSLLAEVTQLDEELAQIEVDKAGLVAGEKEQAVLEDQLETLVKAEEELETTSLQVAATLKQLGQQVPEKWTSLKDLRTYQAELKQEISIWEMNKEKNQQLLTTLNSQLLVCNTKDTGYKETRETTEKRLEELRMKLTQAMESAGQKQSISQLLAGLVDLAKIPSLEKRLIAFKEKQQENHIQLKQVAEKIGGQALPDLTPYQVELASLTEGIRQQERKLIQGEQQFETNERLGKQVKRSYEKLQSQWDELAELNQLSEVANGDGPYNKKSLERYVLQAYFEEILRVANSRLIQLTNNRYSFELKEEQGSYKSQTGLEINIYDDNVGAVRSVNTLSGGESFIAALALSLSLAEVVQNQAGGVQIEAMFIDEGFGALDEEALEMAMDALELVEGQGRMIGIISHVRELKQRIPQQLRVVASGTGTSHIRYQRSQE